MPLNVFEFPNQCLKHLLVSGCYVACNCCSFSGCSQLALKVDIADVSVMALHYLICNISRVHAQTTTIEQQVSKTS